MNSCERCGTQFADTGPQPTPGWAAWSADVWIFITLYDEEGNVANTGEDIDTDDLGDYHMYCPDCLHTVLVAWRRFLETVARPQ